MIGLPPQLIYGEVGRFGAAIVWDRIFWCDGINVRKLDG